MHHMRQFLPLIALAFAATGVGADATRDRVEADWARQDETRLAMIRQPGHLRFAEGELSWPGLPTNDGQKAPIATGEITLDGELTEPVWQEAVCADNNPHVVIADEPYMLSADGFLMPAKKDQAPPDLKYFTQSRK